MMFQPAMACHEGIYRSISAILSGSGGVPMRVKNLQRDTKQLHNQSGFRKPPDFTGTRHLNNYILQTKQ
jgi:hypothetical protein